MEIKGNLTNPLVKLPQRIKKCSVNFCGLVKKVLTVAVDNTDHNFMSASFSRYFHGWEPH